METQIRLVHDSLKPLSYLIGKWKSTSASGHYPTIKPFSYDEEMEFASVGQPVLNYTSRTWHPTKLSPMHLETGYLRIKPGTNDLSFVVAHNFGLTTVEEGCVDGDEVRLKSTRISRASFNKEPAVTETARFFRFDRASSRLEFYFSMATSATPLQEHLAVVYERI